MTQDEVCAEFRALEIPFYGASANGDVQRYGVRPRTFAAEADGSIAIQANVLAIAMDDAVEADRIYRRPDGSLYNARWRGGNADRLIAALKVAKRQHTTPFDVPW